MRACGVLGSVVYIGGFALVQAERICGNGTVYAVSKIIAAILVLISLKSAFNLGSFLIQTGFIAIGLWGLFRRRDTSSVDASTASSTSSFGVNPVPQ